MKQLFLFEYCLYPVHLVWLVQFFHSLVRLFSAYSVLGAVLSKHFIVMF